jgi:hypothetical protein
MGVTWEDLDFVLAPIHHSGSTAVAAMAYGNVGVLFLWRRNMCLFVVVEIFLSSLA